MRALYSSATGMMAQQLNLDVISNNLANVNTTGFKRSRADFQDLLYQQIRPAGVTVAQGAQRPVGLEVGLGVQPGTTETLFDEGTLQNTGNQLDVAINGQGFLQVQMPDGTTAYTRDGSLHLDNQGQIVTSSGYAVQPAITIPTNAQSITIGNDGIVTVTQPGQANATQVGTLQLANFINPAGLESKGENLYMETQASGSPTTSTPGNNGMGTISQGYVETSNVNVVEELVNMIQTQRAYEINSKAVETSDQMLQRLGQL